MSRNIWCICLVLLVLLFCLPDVALAEDTSCFPECRTGYVCAAGQCVVPTPEATSCIPPCRSSYVCNEGQCVADPALACVPDCRTGYVCRSGQCEPNATTGTSSAGNENGRPLAPLPVINYVGLAEEGQRLADLQQEIWGRAHWDLGFFASPWSGAAGFEMNSSELFQIDAHTRSDRFFASDVNSNTWWGPLVGLSFGVRQNFSRHWGYQARLRFTALLYLDQDLDHGSWEEEAFPRLAKFDGFGLTGAFDSTLRVGPVSASFPMYFGLGGSIGAFYVQGEAKSEAQSIQDLPGYTTALSEVYVLPGGVTELGLLLGDEGDYDLGVRFTAEFPDPGSASFFNSVTLNFSFSLN